MKRQKKCSNQSSPESTTSSLVSLIFKEHNHAFWVTVMLVDDYDFKRQKKEQHFKYSAMSLQALLPQVMRNTGAPRH